MKKYLLTNSTVVLVLYLSLFQGGCALQTKKAPAPLEQEVKSLEDKKNTHAYQSQATTAKTIYTVKKGDTLWHISKSYGVSVESILRSNQISDTRDLKVGQKLIIPVSNNSYTANIQRSGYSQTTYTTSGISSSGFIWPVKGAVTSQFGDVRVGVKNTGIYIQPQPGQKIVAAKKGTVEAVSDEGNGFYTIVIKHEKGIRTMYRCRCNPMVGEGRYVEQGQPISNIVQGSIGNSAEVCFKIYIKDKPANPMSYLP